MTRATRRPLALLLLVAALVGVAVAVRSAREEDGEGAAPDRSGAGIPLDVRQRAPLGATADAHVVARAEEPWWVRDLATWNPPAPRTSAGRLLAYAWAAPVSLAGLLVGLLTASRPRVRDGVLVFADARGPAAWALRRGGFAATTLGHVVIARADPSPWLMAHELAHTRHAERLGVLTGPVYWYLLIRYGYARHPLERAARREGRRVRLAA